MDLNLKFGTDGLDWLAICDIFVRAPLGRRDPEKLRRATEASVVVCTAWDGDTVIGFGRALSDGEYQSAIYDVVVLPEYQGRGVGRAITDALLERVPKATVLIYAVPGKEGFYRKLGFELLTTGMGWFANPEGMRMLGYIR